MRRKLIGFVIFLANVTSAAEVPLAVPKISASASASASAALAREWALGSPNEGFEGTQTRRAYAELHLQPATTPIIVAVIDSGIDVEHPDLKAAIWINRKEAEGKPGIDDDGNGYVDDVHGWNFLGSADGKQEVGKAPLEFARMVGQLTRKKKAGPLTEVEEAALTKAQAAYQKNAGPILTALTTLNQVIAGFDQVVEQLAAAGVTANTTAELAALPATHAAVVAAKALASQSRTLKSAFGSGTAFSQLRSELVKNHDRIAAMLEDNSFSLNADVDQITGDDPANYSQRFYGNPKTISDPDNGLHGTHVAGIIAAQRDNGVGMDGQCAWAKIMCLRAVPDGDERDKDIANAVLYAVENGAKIINCSFSKAFSPGKSAVDAAFRIAEAKGVLVVKAAGNEATDLDRNDTFPNRVPLDQPTQPFTNWLVVGASTQRKIGLVASFSNYGKTQVDLFAPGDQIYSTLPDDHYQLLDGTSMAAPEVAGVAALVWSQYPQLTVQELRATLMATARQYPTLKVRRPSTGGAITRVPFADLSASGGVVDAYAALVYLRDHEGKAPALIAAVPRTP